MAVGRRSRIARFGEGGGGGQSIDMARERMPAVIVQDTHVRPTCIISIDLSISDGVANASEGRTWHEGLRSIHRVFPAGKFSAKGVFIFGG